MCQQPACMVGMNLLVQKKGMKSQRLKASGLKADPLARTEPRDKASYMQPPRANPSQKGRWPRGTQPARPVDSGDTHRYVTCPARGISGSGSTGTCSGSSSESCSSARTSHTPASCGLSGGRNPAGRWHRGGRGAGGQGNSSVSTCGLGPGWFIIPRSLTEVQPGGEEEPWVSDTSRVSISRRGRLVGEGGCRGGTMEGSPRAGAGYHVCDTAGSRQGGMEEQAAGRLQPAGMSGRSWATNAAPLASAVGERISEAHPSCGQ